MRRWKIWKKEFIHVFSPIKPKRRSILGIDLRLDSIYIVELSIRDNLLEVYSGGFAQFSETNEDPFCDNHREAVASCLSDLLHQSAVKSRCAAIALPDSLVDTCIVQLRNDLYVQEMESVLLMQAEKRLGVSRAELTVDFNILQKNAKNTALNDVMLVSTLAVNVSKRMWVLEQAGVTLKVVDIESLVLERLMLQLGNHHSEKNALINPFQTMAWGEQCNQSSLQHQASSYALACGLALRGLRDDDN